MKAAVRAPGAPQVRLVWQRQGRGAATCVVRSWPSTSMSTSTIFFFSPAPPARSITPRVSIHHGPARRIAAEPTPGPARAEHPRASWGAIGPGTGRGSGGQGHLCLSSLWLHSKPQLPRLRACRSAPQCTCRVAMAQVRSVPGPAARTTTGLCRSQPLQTGALTSCSSPFRSGSAIRRAPRQYRASKPKRIAACAASVPGSCTASVQHRTPCQYRTKHSTRVR